ncbi:MAG: hypothetical protein QGG40_03515, partial [Myxococcota bacterium]|nr:hypothetical protein [Myxococcota bacterium]
GISEADLFPRDQVEVQMSTVRILADEAESRCSSDSPPVACPSVEEAWLRVDEQSRNYAAAMDSWFEAREMNETGARDFNQATVQVMIARQAYEQSVLGLAQPASAVLDAGPETVAELH